MSIVALKRKTAVLYNNLSVNQQQFSINGTTRNQGYVGQTSLSRSIIHTPHKGSVLKGHGGCCGTFLATNIKASETFSLEDNTVIKKSTLSTKGMLATKNRWINRPYPNAVVKVDGGRNINDQTDYITRLKKKTLSDIATYCPPDVAKTVDYVARPACANLKTSAGFPIFKQSVTCTIAKPASTYTSISQEEYLAKLHKKCEELDDYKFVSPVQRTPFVGNN